MALDNNKQYIMKKIDFTLPENNKFRDTVYNFFNCSKDYFTNEVDYRISEPLNNNKSQKYLLKLRTSKSTKANIIPFLNTRKKKLEKTISLRYDYIKKISSRRTSIKKNMFTNINSVDREMVNTIYDEFEHNHTINKSPLTYDLNTLKQLKLQEKTLKKREMEKKDEKLLRTKLIEKTGKKEKPLLMNNSYDYRKFAEKRRLKDTYSPIIGKWVKLLRSPNNKINDSKDKIYYKNRGSYISPVWKLCNKENETERIFDYDNNSINQKYNTVNNSNNYNFDEKNEGLFLVGEKLLNFERKNFRKLKGNNFIIKKIPKKRRELLNFKIENYTNKPINKENLINNINLKKTLKVINI